MEQRNPLHVSFVNPSSEQNAEHMETAFSIYPIHKANMDKVKEMVKNDKSIRKSLRIGR